MSEEEIEELKDFTIDINDIDELALGLEVCSKKSNMVIQEFADIIIQLQQQNKKLQQRIDKAIEYIKIYRSYQKIDNKDYLKGRDEIGCLDICQVDELLDILKEVE